MDGWICKFSIQSDRSIVCVVLQLTVPRKIIDFAKLTFCRLLSGSVCLQTCYCALNRALWAEALKTFAFFFNTCSYPTVVFYIAFDSFSGTSVPCSSSSSSSSSTVTASLSLLRKFYVVIQIHSLDGSTGWCRLYIALIPLFGHQAQGACGL